MIKGLRKLVKRRKFKVHVSVAKQQEYRLCCISKQLGMSHKIRFMFFCKGEFSFDLCNYLFFSFLKIEHNLYVLFVTEEGQHVCHI